MFVKKKNRKRKEQTQKPKTLEQTLQTWCQVLSETLHNLCVLYIDRLANDVMNFTLAKPFSLPLSLLFCLLSRLMFLVPFSKNFSVCPWREKKHRRSKIRSKRMEKSVEDVKTCLILSPSIYTTAAASDCVCKRLSFSFNFTIPLHTLIPFHSD